MKNSNLKWMIPIILILGYVEVLNLYFEYIVNREVNEAIQLGASLIVIAYSIWQITFITNFIKKS
jgi:hypothetical protein